ncbi:dephospho-CoA kinase [Listeria fleischmannii 1991]|uniref:Dephospho-CoA kinase n=2 Tax=Listeria fleischmannii TaxID=1069827 RepID=A0A2X3HEE7_9LIST|nr:dephospho-CoA kinase [Listeria fleischmannii]EMG27912.1 dephospho-CoA kinase [Listeria fleischmannii subsp. fleischmannii LU2006-1]KMT60833.1 dephospho-CoA kinase [Listeria fleischmannii 1991]SQC69644.1 Dephospho-CoA kinase [Listeria fleischmannii subsp. fleischmannii]
MGMTIGLTGSIATGKSTVSKMFMEAGLPVVDADISAREVVLPGSMGLSQIITTFGESVLQADGTLDRAKLGDLIFNSKEKRTQLNAIVHPLVREDMLSKRRLLFEKGEPFVVFDIPLLFESQLTDLVDVIVVVATEEKTQLARLMARNHLSEEAAGKRIASQMPISEKINYADFVIHNDGTLMATREQVNEFLQQLKSHGIINKK